jgi:AcrR family transcriptional regulator
MDSSPNAKKRDAARQQAAQHDAPASQPIARGKKARERVLHAALAVLADEGMPGFSMEAVAQRAGASKATLYRHWTSREELLVDAMESISQPFAVPETGQLRSDLIEILENLENLFSSQPFPRLLAAFVDAAERDSVLKSMHFSLTERRREPLRQIFAAAVKRREIPRTTDIDLLIDLLAGPFFYRRFVAHRPFPHSYISAIVDQVLASITHQKRN